MPVPVEQLLNSEILKPARYLGNEFGAVRKPWGNAIVRWSLTYPEIYEVGASNLGHIILYSIINSKDGQLCDRAYLPAPDLSAKLRETNTDLFAVESKRSLREFDILGFSLSYELGATNVLEMLDLANIPMTWLERSELSIEDCPLIFAGGQTATSNPEPYADFFDFFALGDGEELLPEIGEVLKDSKLAGKNRRETLLALANEVDGVYVPEFYDMDIKTGAIAPNRNDVSPRALRRVATPMPEHSIGLVPLVETVHDRLTIEIRRGCTRGCRFCQPGMLTRPARDVDPEKVVDTIEKALRETGYNEFSLLSLSCSDYLALPSVGVQIKNRFKDEHITLSLPSQRVDRFDENIAHMLRSGDGRQQQGLTFAPEAGTQRLRDVINKGLTDEELLQGIKTAYTQGWDKVKLYFMIGLPTETDEDVIGIVDTVAWLQNECSEKGRKKLAVNITISNFTPKPHTPFQWHTVSSGDFVQKQKLLRQEFRRLSGVKVNYTDIRISAMEDFVGRGDRRLGKVVYRAWQLGAGMDSWFENTEKAFGAWTQAIAEADLVWDAPSLKIPDPLPWDHIDTGIDKQWLIEDWERAIAAQTVPDCSFGGCSACGVCGPAFGHNIVIPPPEIPTISLEMPIVPPRVQRVRLKFGKLGDMSLISHLDLHRFFQRAARRAAIPVAHTEGFNPLPRISIAKALPLGQTSNAEFVDFELTSHIPIAEFQQRFSAELDDDLPIYAIEEVEVHSPSLDSILEVAEYTLTLAFISGIYINAADIIDFLV
ncbi:MAG: TIGR03960 family B12-binding radical SAM protein, partial [Pseudanabaena sp.]